MANELTDSEKFTNRELSWLDFDDRILSEARDASIPLMERLKFLSITSSNLDEFFMVRVASLKDQVNAGYKGLDIAGLTAREQIEAILSYTHDFVERQYSTYNRSFLPLLKSNGLKIISYFEDLNEEQSEYVDKYFRSEVFPVLTPMAVDSSRPFPLIRNKYLNIGALLQDKQNKNNVDFATVQVPSGLPRVVTIPTDEDGCSTVILLEQIIEKNIHRLFSGYKVLCATPYRVMRNADLPFDEDEAADLLIEIEKQLKRRQWGEPIRLEVEADIDKQLLKLLKRELPINEESIYRIRGPLDLTFLMKVYNLDGFDHLKEKPFTPQQPKYLVPDIDLFEQIRDHDILLHHPYETFDPVVRFIRQASQDPDVLAIKQTLYRVSSHSPIIASLADAAENGKQVSVLVELKARFDEENNIVWARKLEEAGCHVIYGLVGLKTHSKITLVVRREEDGIRRYVHLGTGNYNDTTAKLYTDMGLLTCKRAYGEDATAVFNMLSGYSEPLGWNKLTLAPQWLRDKFLKLIEREAENAIKGRPSHIIAKMNSLCDKEVIEALYDASEKGVEIDLIIRGICCLKAGIPGLSENIHVRSIVGTFLEHSRIFYFENNGAPEIYMGSADWMPRNLDKRVEILFPVEDPVLKDDVIDILQIQLSDTKKARIMQPDGHYEKIDMRGKKAIGAQETFCSLALKNAKK
ncbi:MAG: RNA degradosome polyphosphate kinase [Eubacterium sp.]|nr:RNA degradosome polyphosphate kinase [Eubacterium sp.]